MSQIIEREILILEADPTNVPRSVCLAKMASFRPFRSELLPYNERFEKDDYCDFDLTDICYLSRENADIFKLFPRKIRTPIASLAFIYPLSLTNDNTTTTEQLLHSKSTEPAKDLKPLPLVPYSDSDSDSDSDYADTDTDENADTIIPNQANKIKLVFKTQSRMAQEGIENIKKRKRKRKSGGGGGIGIGIGKRNKNVKVVDGPDPPPPMPAEMREKIESAEGSWQGYGAVLVLQKKLFDSDLKTQQNRLSMPIKQLESLEFLSEEERDEAKVRDQITRRIVGIKGVRLMDPKLKEYRVDFKMWNLKKTFSYVLTNKWSSVVKNNQFKLGEIVQIWFFRDRDHNPCFALVNLSRPSC